jgi:sigma-E factor negative regulatory protein RseA
MSEKDERLSALVDNALDSRELNEFMCDLKRDPVDDAERIQRYRIISDVMSDDLSEISLMDISAAVQRAIEQEAPLQVSSRPRTRLFYFPALAKPLTGMAIAASVAMVTVLAVRMVQVDTPPEQIQAVAEVSQQPITPVNPAIAQHVRAAATEPGQPNLQRNSQLNEYMMNHSGYAGQATVPGMMPYVRVIGFDAETR